LLRSVEIDAAVDERLREIRARTFIVHGRNDRLVPFRVAEHLAARIPGAELIALERTGHAPHLEEPAVVRAAIRAALG
jgi:pimeloyl-ACP methyl ester carboxylesterase